MFCSNCGSQIDDNAVVCPHCGVATSNFNQTTNAAAQRKTNILALVGFILSFFVAIAGLICSIIGYKRAPEYGGDGKGFALAGIIISAVELAANILVIVIYVIYVIALVGTTGVVV